MLVKTRFAPSPTGALHVGSVRTALFSWLYARHHQGQFFLRIEDTDHERSTQESVQVILDGMQWLGLDYDGDPVYQTDRYARYMECIQQLLEKKLAYRCSCSKERLEKLRETQLEMREKPRYDGHCRDLNLPASDMQVIRFKNPTSGVVSFTDEVYGKIDVQNSELDDLILLRSDGHPTYNFAVVIDDLDMGITNVIRGDDHINNTPRQINLFHALGATPPQYAHLPMILGEDGKRLSKRHGAVNVLQFKEQGFLPHALLNYLVRLGWSHGDQEIFSREEMIQYFDLHHVSRGVSSFNYAKLNWLNQHYLKTEPTKNFVDALAWHFAESQIDLTNGPALEDLISIQADRCKTLAEMCEKSLYFYQDEVNYNEEDVNKFLKPEAINLLMVLREKLCNLQNWDVANLHQCIQDVCTDLQVGFGKIAQPLRVAVTGTSSSPSIDATLMLIGKSRVLARLDRIKTC
jgi:glutamyl-tRNA synthetase